LSGATSFRRNRLPPAGTRKRSISMRFFATLAMRSSALARLQTVVFPEPRHEARDPLVDRDARQEAEVARRRLDIGIGLRHVARLQRRELDAGLAVARPLDHLDEAHERLAAVIAEIVEAVGRGPAESGPL